MNVFNIGQHEEYQKSLLTKSNHWEYEQEWRVIKTPNEGGSGLRAFFPESLTGVIFGALIAPEDKQKVMVWITKYPTRITLYRVSAVRLID